MSQSVSIEQIDFVASKLSDILDRFVFVGGSVAGLLVTDPSAAIPRETDDIDLIVEVANRISYASLTRDLSKLGFHQEFMEKVVCRFKGYGITLDVMPTDESVLGFSNPWYASAIKHALIFTLPSNQKIRIIDGPHFLATKLTAFHDRGKGDVYLSHDLEDIVSVLNGRNEIVSEVKNSDPRLIVFLKKSLAELARHPDLQIVVEGHLAEISDSAEQSLVVLDRIMEICSM